MWLLWLFLDFDKFIADTLATYRDRVELLSIKFNKEIIKINTSIKRKNKVCSKNVLLFEKSVLGNKNLSNQKKNHKSFVSFFSF